jgi:histidine triad (HIT) family protein
MTHGIFGGALAFVEKDCAFCMIIRKEKPADFVFEDESVVVIKDIQPHAPVHLLIIPKRHIRSVNDLTEEDKDVVFNMILKAKTMAREQSIAQSGYKLVFNTERGGGQVIFHLHLHLLGGW